VGQAWSGVLERWLGTVLGALLVLTLAATFAPWHRSGTTSRSSYEVVRSAERLGVLDRGLAPTVATAWAFVPAIGTVGLLALALGRWRWALGAAAAAGAMVAWFALVLQQAPGAAWGSVAALVASTALSIVVASAVMIPSSVIDQEDPR
jgi:hypothetical protein